MKKVVTSFVALTMAVLVFYGGAGINIISYCCNDCRVEGIEVLKNDKCCDIHNHNHKNNHRHHQSDCAGSSCDHHTKADNCDTTFKNCDFCYNHSHGNCCSMERINFDWSSQNITELDIDLSPIVLDLLSTDIFNISPVYITMTGDKSPVASNRPPLICPRDYLSVLTVLLI